MRDKCIELLKLRGVEISDIVECVIFLQKKFDATINHENVTSDLMAILDKREVQHTILTGIALDISIDQKALFDEGIMEIIGVDEGRYGIDEVLAYSICNLYGSIALTNFGYIDRVKPGIIGRLNNHSNGQCNTFLDDIVGALAAAAASKNAHK